MSKLAINGGTKTIPADLIKNWPPVDDNDKALVMQALESGRYTYATNSLAFQDEYKAWNGNKHAILTNSGTAALHMCMVACGVGAGDHVIVTSYSWSSSATCILHHNAIPVFVDIDFATMNIDVDKIEKAITPSTKAIVAVHLHGLMVDMDKIMAIARKHNLMVIEDACQAHGAEFNGKKAGTIGHCAAFSFNQNKCLCTGEGGMFVTNDDALLEKGKMLWCFGETKAPNESRDFHAYALGWMYRSNELTAAFGRGQLKKMDSYMEIQEENAGVLNTNLKGVKGLILPTEPPKHKHNWYNYTCRIDNAALGWNGAPDKPRNAIMKALQAEGTSVGIWQSFILPAMTVFRAQNAYGKGCPWACPFNKTQLEYRPEDYPVAQRHCDTHFGMTVPLRAPNRTDVPEKVAEAFLKVFANLDQLDFDKA
ncbi:MAG: hypothetical protein A2X49_01705 [Lentisphaerae bacterium GWF2_52_8]|nr:MAG: hypothetical protein A2X49_01705 [Lentisphaerae bacterium GWF2_52_8]